MRKRRFTVGDYIDALSDVPPKIRVSILRRAREDPDISLPEYALIYRVAQEQNEKN